MSLLIDRAQNTRFVTVLAEVNNVDWEPISKYSLHKIELIHLVTGGAEKN